MAKAKTLDDVYRNADEPHTPAMQKQIMGAGAAAAERERARRKQQSAPVKESQFSDKDEDYEF